jgi:hypothetical protein
MASRLRRTGFGCVWRRGRCLALLLILAAAAGPAAAQLRLSIAPEYATSRQPGEARTVVTTLPLDVAAQTGRVSAKLYVPWLSVGGGTQFLPGIGEVGGARAAGLGDLRLTGAYTLLQGSVAPFDPYIDIALRTRFPTAASPALGTGQMEHVLRLDTGARLSDSLALDASVGRRFVLAPPKGGAGADYWTVDVALGWEAVEGTTLGLSFETQDRTPDSTRPVLELGAFIDREIAPGITLGVFGARGLTRDSAEWTVGLSLVYRGAR